MTDKPAELLDHALHGLAYAAGPPLASAVLKSVPADFRVTELPLVEPSGSGEHVWLYVRKTDRNTGQVADLLARHAGVPGHAVGYAGLKDRRAETRQWFSVQLPGRAAPDWSALESDTLGIERVIRHGRKLQRGALRGNAFVITLRMLSGAAAQLEERLDTIRSQGVPNYFGAQRFGRDAANLVTARRLFAAPRRRIGRSQRALALSAARSLLFNRVLSARVAARSWDRCIGGDALQLAGTHSHFVAGQTDPELDRRLAEFDIHPTGPLYGRGSSPVTGPCSALEQSILADYPDLVRGLEQCGLRQARRALRVVPEQLLWQVPEQGILVLSFSLPAGSYATAVLRELVHTDQNGQQCGASSQPAGAAGA